MSKEEEEQVDVETGYTKSLSDVDDETAQTLQTGRKGKVLLLQHGKDRLGIGTVNLKTAGLGKDDDRMDILYERECDLFFYHLRSFTRFLSWNLVASLGYLEGLLKSTLTLSTCLPLRRQTTQQQLVSLLVVRVDSDVPMTDGLCDVQNPTHIGSKGNQDGTNHWMLPKSSVDTKNQTDKPSCLS